jgi:TetR/AcrR family transcriptional regulator, regulator of autoinduction and epiphytic fitness
METTAKESDGRKIRAERTRQALVDALLGLLDAGELSPTAAAIAERAGVSERSLFQHFPDRETLFEAVARQEYERVMPTLHPVDATLPLDDRVDQFTRQRARLHERIGGVWRAAVRIEHESPAVAGWLTAIRRAMAAESDRVFHRELEAIPPDDQEPVRGALVAACGWAAWEDWRTHQRLGVSRARAAMAAAIGALLRPQR